ncbi:MAG: EAL domain-containing protein [Eubacterium sp.]|nr:EAL domain-containing protein [Eubacterium sp.]
MGKFEMIPEARKSFLDSLFEAFSIIGDDTYVYLCDMQYDYSRWSKVLVELFGLPGEYMYGAGDIWEEHIHPEDREVFHEGIENIFAGKSSGHDMQYRARRKDGGYDVCTCRGIVIKDESGKAQYFGGAIRNHSRQSHVDKLTGLRNQYGFFLDVQSHINNQKVMRACVVGISGLTEINEIYGYEVGNAILQKFGRYLMDHVGARGGTYRMDGAKFAVITESLSYEDLENAYEEVRAHFREGVKKETLNIPIELNAGTLAVENFTTDDQTVYACLNFAYEDSKRNKHGDLVEFYNEINKDSRKHVEKLHDIRNSINNDFEGFYILYQPVVDAKTEKLVGAEALLRWKSERYGMVPPDGFIPFLENDPIFPILGKWILKQAMTDAKRVQEIMPEFVININLSYAQVERSDFVDTVWMIVDQVGFEPDKLCLELTERCRLLNVDLLRNVMTALRAGGIRFALDDFGTGFSSVGLLKELPFDTIKIDRGFVQKIEEDEQEKKLVNNFTQTAGIFETSVCVEGIETVGMRDILKKYSIHSFQGYYYSRPIEIEELLGALNSESGALCFHRD